MTYWLTIAAWALSVCVGVVLMNREYDYDGAQAFAAQAAYYARLIDGQPLTQGNRNNLYLIPNDLSNNT